MANHPAFHYPDIGVLGEDLFARWLQSSGWEILHRRWRCPWGELDLVAKLDVSERDKGDTIKSQVTSHNHELATFTVRYMCGLHGRLDDGIMYVRYGIKPLRTALLDVVTSTQSAVDLNRLVRVSCGSSR